ncbi:unnamed protein product [Clonostachys rhizophaga]|uniref:Uncharacterized protein n=1 Tax=Clonostachys rhizophaga TaxID=160324 RepID=A0A9N9V961_9HYPO|nr:unnamed protein product [Clonostachys rhizophaga]
MPELTIIIDLSKTPLTSHLGFWFFDRESRARLSPERDIRCGNWQEFDVGRNLTTEETKNRIRGIDDKSTDGTAKDLGFYGTGVIETKYAAKHHIVVAGWNPAHSVASFLP